MAIFGKSAHRMESSEILRNTNITDVGVARLAAFRRLEYLVLHSPHITDDALKLIPKVTSGAAVCCKNKASAVLHDFAHSVFLLIFGPQRTSPSAPQALIRTIYGYPHMDIHLWIAEVGYL